MLFLPPPNWYYIDIEFANLDIRSPAFKAVVRNSRGDRDFGILLPAGERRERSKEKAGPERSGPASTAGSCPPGNRFKRV